jgi:hypothetical protein
VNTLACLQGESSYLQTYLQTDDARMRRRSEHNVGRVLVLNSPPAEARTIRHFPVVFKYSSRYTTREGH